MAVADKQSACESRQQQIPLRHSKANGEYDNARRRGRGKCVITVAKTKHDIVDAISREVGLNVRNTINISRKNSLRMGSSDDAR